MKIKWLGHASFVINSKSGDVIITVRSPSGDKDIDITISIYGSVSQ